MANEQRGFGAGLPRQRRDKESTGQCRKCKRRGFEPCDGKIPWSRKWQPTPVFLPGKFHGQGAGWAVVHGVAKSQTRLSECAWQSSNSKPRLARSTCSKLLHFGRRANTYPAALRVCWKAKENIHQAPGTLLSRHTVVV